ncbi:membrane-bound PQQ-dependent dehydrogenase, glucose/quinate/shikimate family [Marinobacter sp. JSM 1782161]|uniref:membrane-bound PQQ-dependent dehydrogenase, glucose/quinate/shikimate family n=1 Tax=Marinobacter sp. JSM 1782161 TaxID=2685906 RepID=UPI00140398FD|nr:membrane-bound PQQ-dependent dehydrogenase, glucose/quinate/shikimate family [Marinobacter sp. JSM 1782161]
MTSQSDASGGGRWFLSLVGVLSALVGIALLVGGVYLITLGGSWYFALMGLATTAAGVLIARKRPAGAWLFGAAFVLTIIWALFDAGLDFWPLVSRLFMFGVMAVVIALCYPALVRASGGRAGRGAFGVAAVLAVALVAGFVHMFQVKPEVVASGAPDVAPSAQGEPDGDWKAWGNTTEGTRFAALDQITRANVKDLEVAWTYRTGDIPESDGFGAEDQATPLQIGDTVYVCTPHNQVFALDADTGEKRWSYDSEATAPNWQRCRGLGYYEQPAPSVTAENEPASPAACQRRIFMTTIDARLIALDAGSGELCEGFGEAGTVDLTQGMGEVKPGFYTLTAAPLVADDLIIVGGRVADNIEVGEPSGVVRAFNVVTGEKVWSWDLGRTDPNADTDEPYTRATPNVWTSMAYDPELDMVYLPTGNTTPDAWGGQRSERDNKYSSAVVALDRKTGAERWVFQTVHHDLWDYDLPAQPTLYDLPDGQGGTIPALIQITKAGQVFMLNRATGKPIARVEERPAPQGNADGEHYAATQPLSTGLPSIGTQTLTEADMWGATPFDQMMCRIAFKQMRYDGLFTPPGEDLSLQWPGSLGGMNWGSASIDPNSGYLFVNDMRLGLWTKLLPRDTMESQEGGGVEMGAASQTGTPYGSLRNRFMSPMGVPCQEPPFGTMTAIDLKQRKVAWQVPVGTVEDTGPLGIKMHLPVEVGLPTLGPSLATESGLVFFAGTQDYYLRAFDSATGKEVWKQRLPVGSQGGPMTYVSPETGKQYIVVTAGGARQSPDRGDYVIAYALPDGADRK